MLYRKGEESKIISVEMTIRAALCCGACEFYRGYGCYKAQPLNPEKPCQHHYEKIEATDYCNLFQRYRR